MFSYQIGRRIRTLLAVVATYTIANFWTDNVAVIQAGKQPKEQRGNNDKPRQIEHAVQETTRILYKDSTNLSYWLSARLPKVYIYDTLSEDWSSSRNISQCIDTSYGLDSMANQNWTGCRWEPQVCDKSPPSPLVGGKQATFVGYKSNYNNDVAYLKWFRGYEHRTYNASEADLFLVPYPHKSHCLCRKDFARRRATCDVDPQEIRERVLKKLTYFEQHKDRHLFLVGTDWGQARPLLRQIHSSMSISLGPVEFCKDKAGLLCGHQLTPYINLASSYQPDAIQNLTEKWWVSRNRSRSVGAVMSTPPALKLRFELGRNKSLYIPEVVGGLPTKVILNGDSRHPPSPDEILEIYRESVFCPILPGDGAVQKRFFDVILQGCIPVVPIYYPSNEEVYPTFFQWSGRPSIRQSYPFHRGTFFGDDKVGIDYLDLVVTFDGFCGLSCMKPAMETVMGNSTEMIRLRQNLREYAQLFTFGLDENMYNFVDSFSAILVAIRHYLVSLDNEAWSAAL